MKLSTLFTMNVLVAGLFGLGFMCCPETMLEPYDIAPEKIAASVMMSRFFGAANFGYAILFWFMRKVEASAARSAVVKASCLSFAVGCVVSLFNQMSGEIGPLGWSTVALYGLFSLAYAYFGFCQDAES